MPTPELAAPGELVVWCVQCRSHEVRRPRRALFRLGTTPSSRWARPA